MKTPMTPERRAEVLAERKDQLERGRARAAENRAALVREREISLMAAQARFAPPGDMPEKDRVAAAIRREAIADYEEAKAEAARNAAPEDLEAIAKAAAYKVAAPEPEGSLMAMCPIHGVYDTCPHISPRAEPPEPPPRVMAPIVHEGAVAPPRVVEPERTAPPPPIVEPEEQHIEPDPMTLDQIEGEQPQLPADDFERFLAAQDDETREVLSDVELRVIFEAETKRAQDERKAQIRKAAAARAQRHAKATAGLLPAEAIAAAALRDRLAQKVEWTVNMPEAGNSGMLIDEGIRINGRLLQHGERVRGTLAEYESYRAIEWNAHQNELDFQGRGKMSKLRQTATGFINMKGQTV